MGLRKKVGLILASALVAVNITTVTPAQADLQHPRQDFLRNSVGGLFLHWGLRTSPQHTSCSAWESDVTNGGWSANYWVNEAEKLHVQYVVLTTFHSRLGYARPYPSAIPGSCRTSRDFVRELIDATNARGMKTIMYMTDDPQWFNEGLGSGQSWLNSSAYSSWKGRTVNLHTRDGFGEYSYDLFLEVADRYPDLGGFWIDNDNAIWEDRGLYAEIYRRRPNYTISNNNEDTSIMDMISNEQKTGMTPSYDYPQAVYTAAPRLIEADFKLPSSGAWWYDGSNPTVDRRLTTGRYLTNVGSSIKALMAETAQVNGRFPSNQESYNNFADTYFDPIWESIEGTEGGGYMHGGLKPGFWNDGAHGVTTVKRNNPNQHYIHALTRPSGSTLRLRDNGYAVSSVTNLRTGAAVSFTQSGGNLTLSGISSWDQYDTVFKVMTSGREHIYPASSITMSASASASGHPASHAADGNYLTYWDSNRTVPVSLRFDLGSTKRVQYLGINQREWSPTHRRDGFGGLMDSARIRDYRVYFSSDGTNWGSPIKTGTLASHRGVAVIDLPAGNTRHIRLEVVNTWAASDVSRDVNRLAIDEAWVASDYPGGGVVEPPSGRYEAESATINQGVVESNHAGFSGTGFVNGDNVVGSGVTWTVNATAAGPHTIAIGYANGTTASRPMTVNGTTLDFAPTGAWTTYARATLTLSLSAGPNTITATSTTANGGPNLDYVDVAAAGPSPVAYQAEDATIIQGVVESNHAGFTGTGFVNGDNVVGSGVEWTVTAAAAGPATIAIRYGNGTTATRPMTINGTTVDFAPTGAWTTWAEVTLTLDLSAGSNTITATSTTANGGPNLDRLTVG